MLDLRRLHMPGVVLGLTAATVFALALLPLRSQESGHGNQCAMQGFDLPTEGLLLEGIGVDRETQVFYVSGVNDGGDIYRGRVGSEDLELWFDDNGTTGRGIDVDSQGRVFVAGGPTGTLRIFDREAQLLATVDTGEADSFLNDVWIAPDGTAFVTDSSLPIIWQVTQHGAGTWSIGEFLDVSGTIEFTPELTDFDLGGIVVARGGRFILTSQGTTGQLWRIDVSTKEIAEVDLGGVRINNADGIVLVGGVLWVVQNFRRQISVFVVNRDLSRARLIAIRQTPEDRTFTTAAFVQGRLLVVDSQFGFDPTSAPAEDRVSALRLFPCRR